MTFANYEGLYLHCDSYSLMKRQGTTLRFLWLCFFCIVCGQIHAQDQNDWLQAQLNASADLRHVDYEEMYVKALQKDMGIDPLIKCLVIIDYCRAYGMDSLAIKMADFVLEKANNQQLEKGIAAYLLDLKYRLALLQNRYDEIEQMACYLDRRWQEDYKLMERASHWHRLAKEGKEIRPVSILRSKNTVSLAFPDVVYSMQLGVVDSLRIDGIKLCNLPVWVSDETNEYDCVGFIGTPDLFRLGYMELSCDSIVFRYPLPEQKAEANFTMNAGKRGERCICLPCTLDGHDSSFVLDTGSNSFLLPRQYAEHKKGFFAEVGGVRMWLEAGMYAHGFIPFSDSRGFWGQPLLWSFERLCINFRDAHVDYIKKKDVKFTEYLNK